MKENTWTEEDMVLIAFDIGTTQSAVTYAYLLKDTEIEPVRVHQWPGQAPRDAGCSVPSILVYDKSGKARACGAEVKREEANSYGWSIAEHWKLHRHPPSLISPHPIELTPLPNGVSLETIYRDFMRYLLQQTQAHFETTQPDGKYLWSQHRHQVEFVIAHPNGWGLNEQAFLREAAEYAGLVRSKDEASRRISFVTEGEASFHFVFYHTRLHALHGLNVDSRLVVCDAGGSTVDTITYKIAATSPQVALHETKASSCVQTGGIYVDQLFEKYLRGALSAATINPADYVETGRSSFELEAKKSFDGTNSVTINLEDKKLDSSALNIIRGKMTLQSGKIAPFFQPCLDEMLLALQAQMSNQDVQYLLLVGGLGNSPYLRAQLESKYPERPQVILANDTQSRAAKAVSDGAFIWRTALKVRARAARFSYVIDIYIPYDPADPEHQRYTSWVDDDDGITYISGACRCIVKKGQIIHFAEKFHQSFYRSYRLDLSNYPSDIISSKLYAYTGPGNVPDWIRDPQGKFYPGFENVCNISAPAIEVKGALETRRGPNGAYKYLGFDIAIMFGGTELRALIEWTSNGQMVSGPASIIAFRKPGANTRTP